MTDINSIFEGLDPSVVEHVSNPAVMERLQAFVEKAKEPVLNKNTEVLGKYNNLNEQIKAFGGLDKIKALSEAAAETERQKAIAAKSSTDAEQLRAHFEKEIADRERAYAELQSSWINEKKSAAITKALADAGADVGLLGVHLERRLKAEVTDGKVNLTVLDANGNAMLTKGAKAAQLSDLVEEYRNSFPAAFSASTESGSGAKASASVQKMANPWMKPTLNYTEQMRIAKDDPALAKQLAALAGLNLNI